MPFLASTANAGAPAEGGGTALALFVVIVAVIVWIGMRVLLRRMRAGKADAVVHGDFAAFALEALANAAKLDGRASDPERAAIAQAMREIAGADFDASRVQSALSSAMLGKDELVAYLAEKGRAFTHAQKVQFLKALLAVFVADGRFEENEHHALVEYTAAIGFDRQSAPQRLRGLLSDMAKDRIT
jgi:uncharacterized membrane protein YebE (DUF533 family)